MKQVYRVKVAGTPLNIVTEEEESYLLSLTDKLSRTITDIVMHNKSASKLDAALLCALDGMDNEIKMQKMIERLREDNTRLLSQLETLKKNPNAKRK